jgi:hypothetical protein
MTTCVVVANASYAADPGYVAPDEPTSGTIEEPTKIVSADAVEERVSEGEAVFLKPAADEPVIVDKSTLAVIAQASAPVTFVNVDTAVTLTIDPAKMTDAVIEVDLNIPVVPAEDGKGIVIAPPTHGEYGFTISLQIPTTALPADFDVNNAVCYYIADDNTVTKYDGYFEVIDGNIFFEFDHASSYLITDDPSMVVMPAGEETTEAEPEEIDPSEDTDFAEETEEEITEEIGEESEPEEDITTEEVTTVEETTTAEVTEAPAAVGDTEATGNPKTGVTLAIGTVIAAGAVAIITKKRK